MKKVRIGVIGCGGIANGKHLPAHKHNPDSEMVAFCDIIVERAEKAAKEYGIPGAKVYKDYKELLKDKTIDAVLVLTPNISHSFISVDAMKAGKHVMCEKPMAINSKEAQKMLDAAKKYKRILTIGYQSRYTPQAIFLKKECEKGTFGDIYYAKAQAIRRRAVPTWGVFLDEKQQGGGPLIDIATHTLDLTLYMLNNYEPAYAVGTTYHKLNKQTDQGNAWGDWDPKKFTVEDSAFGFVVMKNGATIIVESSWALNTLSTGEACTEFSGTLAGADMKDGLRINGIKNNARYVLKPDLKASGVAFYDGHSESSEDREARVFTQAVLGKGELVVKAEQAFVVTQILEGIYTSAKTGKPFYFKKQKSAKK
ncbi:Gfo/Idh/MocA family oxidoreductase [bacterium]|nr:Gfo/Idh/MocA family oxidoreductase [bacterium]